MLASAMLLRWHDAPALHFDSETGLHYNWNRDYNPKLGRYIQSDPIGLEGGISTYGYVGGNPINAVDPSGLFVTSVDATCMMDPAFCAEITGQMIQNLGALSGDPCVTEAADTAANNIRNIGTTISIINIGRALSSFAQAGKDLVKLTKRFGRTEANSSIRGISGHGGIFTSVTNAAGGKVWTSTGPIAQKDFATYVNGGLYKGEVNIISGVHGTAEGKTIIDASLHEADMIRFGDIPGVRIHNFPDLSPAQISDLLKTPGTTIGGFCYSGVCLAPFK